MLSKGTQKCEAMKKTGMGKKESKVVREAGYKKEENGERQEGERNGMNF